MLHFFWRITVKAFHHRISALTVQSADSLQMIRIIPSLKKFSAQHLWQHARMGDGCRLNLVEEVDQLFRCDDVA